MQPVRPRELDESAVGADQPSVIAAMWRYRWLVVLIVAVFAVLGLVFNEYRPAGYEATASRLVLTVLDNVASRIETCCEPPTKRDSWAPPAVRVSRSRLPPECR